VYVAVTDVSDAVWLSNASVSVNLTSAPKMAPLVTVSGVVAYWLPGVAVSTTVTL